MSTLLVTLKGNRLFNKTLFSPHLYIHDDLLIYKKRKWFVVREMTISYTQVARFTLARGIFFAHINIITTGADEMEIKFVSKKDAAQAKSIVDQKIYRAHAKHNISKQEGGGGIGSFEKTMNRLKELQTKGKISEKEYEKKKKDLLKDL
ncbi:hypothetical protein ACFLZ4_00510 [Patescibacteria group bacterium]